MVSEILIYIWDSFVAFLGYTWWFLAFLILFPATHSMWLHWRQSVYKHSLKWVFLEIRIPRLNERSPQGMEQVLAAIHALINAPGDLQERYWDGEVSRWYSFEMVSFGGEVHFYLRAPLRQKNLIQAAFFAYYPDVEIIEAEDYAERLPHNADEVYEDGLDIWGSEMVLKRSSMYPIKSYHDFEAPEEERQFDPLSSFLEVLGKLAANEFVGIQINCVPLKAEWVKEFDHELNKLKEPKVKEGKKGPEDTATAFGKLIARSPGEIEVLEAVENNLSKPGFSVLVRFIYLSPKAGFYDTYPRRGIIGAFNQYSSLDLNAFQQNYDKSTRVKIWNWPFIFPGRRNEYRKNRLLHDYHHREIPEETFMGELVHTYILNSGFASKMFKMSLESIATLFHPPTAVVLTAPHVKRVESRKGSPPAGLAIFGEEKSIEKFQ